MQQLEDLLNPLRVLHEQIRDAVVTACERSSIEALSGIAKEEEGDTIYEVDKVSETLLIEFVKREIASRAPVVLIAEGLEGGMIVLPEGTPEAQARWRIIVDPIDGTRGLMYQKRSAWILTGVAPNKGPETTLQDIELALQTELPIVKQHLCDTLWALRGKGVYGERFNRVDGTRIPFHPRPSTTPTIGHGFSTVVRFFPGARVELSEIDEELVLAALGPVQTGKALCFEDQYACTGGQLYELIAGHDRFIADLRPLMEQMLAQRKLRLGICCHPYDLATELIAREAGVIVTDPFGQPLKAPLNLEADVAWVGYANAAIQTQLQPQLKMALRKRKLWQEPEV